MFTVNENQVKPVVKKTQIVPFSFGTVGHQFIIKNSSLRKKEKSANVLVKI